MVGPGNAGAEMFHAQFVQQRDRPIDRGVVLVVEPLAHAELLAQQTIARSRTRMPNEISHLRDAHPEPFVVASAFSISRTTSCGLMSRLISASSCSGGR